MFLLILARPNLAGDTLLLHVPEKKCRRRNCSTKGPIFQGDVSPSNKTMCVWDYGRCRTLGRLLRTLYQGDRSMDRRFEHRMSCRFCSAVEKRWCNGQRGVEAFLKSSVRHCEANASRMGFYASLTEAETIFRTTRIGADICRRRI